MVCVHCGHKTQVINSRPQRRTNQVWRRRLCIDCGALFSTTEAADYSALWAVKQPSGSLQPFSRDKLLLSLHRSCQHRSTAVADAASLADTIITKLRAQATGGHLSPRQIAQTAQVALNRFDAASSVHYQAMHK